MPQRFITSQFQCQKVCNPACIRVPSRGREWDLTSFLGTAGPFLDRTCLWYHRYSVPPQHLLSACLYMSFSSCSPLHGVYAFSFIKTFGMGSKAYFNLREFHHKSLDILYFIDPFPTDPISTRLLEGVTMKHISDQ